MNLERAMKDLERRERAWWNLLRAAKEVMADLAEHGPSIVPHLMDTDNNAGQRLRDAIAEVQKS